MEKYEEQIREYKSFVQEKCVKEEAQEQTIRVCQSILKESSGNRASYFEFLYEQSKFIQKRWWILQASVLAFLGFWLSGYTKDYTNAVRLMGIFATVFVILIVPEIWKNRRNRAVEIEQASYYTLRQICAARTLLFAAVDLAIVMIFLTATYRAVSIPLYDLIVNFLLPVNVSCCICFRLLYSQWCESEYLAVFFCLVWVGVWTMIVANEEIYQRVAEPVWGVLLALTFAYVVFCVRKSLMFDEKILEGYADEAGI